MIECAWRMMPHAHRRTEPAFAQPPLTSASRNSSCWSKPSATCSTRMEAIAPLRNKKAADFPLSKKIWQSFKKAKKERMKEMGSSERPALRDNPPKPTVAFGWHPSGAGRTPECLQNVGMFRRCSFCLTRTAGSCVYKVTWWQGLF